MLPRHYKAWASEKKLAESHRHLTEQVSSQIHIIGESPSTLGLRSTIERLAATDLPVLLLGESGTGKEVVSQSLHYHGSRAGQPFIPINCAALSETLLENELFGHEKGSFTDAHDERPGKFEQANGGTIFLDEIGDMSLAGQAKLLRVIEQKKVTRIGGENLIPVDVRIIAATNMKLVEAVQEKKFREDLYYRLSVVHHRYSSSSRTPRRRSASHAIFLGTILQTSRTRVTNAINRSTQKVAIAPLARECTRTTKLNRANRVPCRRPKNRTRRPCFYP